MKVIHKTNNKGQTIGYETVSKIPNKNRKIVMKKDKDIKYFYYDSFIDKGNKFVLINSNNVIEVMK